MFEWFQSDDLEINLNTIPSFDNLLRMKQIINHERQFLDTKCQYF